MKNHLYQSKLLPLVSRKRCLLLLLFLKITLPVLAHTNGFYAVKSSGSRAEASTTLADEQVVSFSLINADTDQAIQTITSGTTLNLATLPTKNLNIRANTNPSTVGSVVLLLSGTQSRSQTETSAPYALFPDVSGNYSAWTPATGSYTLKATPYSAAGGGGTAGTALSVNFTVTNSSPTTGQQVVSFSLINADTDQAIQTITSGATLNLATLPTKNLNIRANTNPSTVGSVKFILSGTQSRSQTETSAPYALFPDVSGNYSAWTPATGSYTLKATPYSAASGGGTAGTALSINFTVSNTTTTTPSIYWSTNTQNLTVDKGSSSTGKTFSLDLSNSRNSSITYRLSAVYGSGASGWLSFNASHAGTEPNVTFNYGAAVNLAAGTYRATVTAAATGYTSGTLTVQVTVRAPTNTRPYVISSTPANNATNVSVNTPSIAANNLYVPEVEGYKGGVNNATITTSTVKLLKVTSSGTTQILGVVQGTGGGDAISFSPSYALEPYTNYRFMVTDGVKSYSGAAFMPYTANFKTGAATNPGTELNVQFTKVAIPNTQGKKYTSLTFGPDGKFYALRLDGVIERFTVTHSTGMLSNRQEIRTLVTKYGNRSAVGLAFAPNATASSLIAYVSHCSSGLSAAPEFDGKISRLTGSSLGSEQLVITKLPRSTKDHLVNSLAFGPDGALYFCQGSNSSMGAYDNAWQRTESLLAGAVLRLSISKLSGLSLPIDVQTTASASVIKAASTTSMRMSDGTYNPYGSSAPLTIYASGVRNAYDLVWHSNGQLYVPANGSAAGGNSPASVAGTRRPDGTLYSGPSIPATSAVQVQNDWLYRINPNRGVGYFGHPNPLRGEYVVNRGYADNSKYPSTVVADKNYRPAAYNFQLNRSPNGVIEYKSSAFNGALKGRLLVCRFSGGGDIMVLKPGSLVKGSTESNYDIKETYTGAGTDGLEGMAGFTNPLDITEDVQTGNLYVIEFNWNNLSDRTAQITLLRVNSSASQSGIASVFPAMISEQATVTEPALTSARKATTSSEQAIASETTGKEHAITIANTGRGPLTITDIALTGADASQFVIKGAPTAKANAPLVIRKHASITFNVVFAPTSKGLKTAQLQISSDKNPVSVVALSGLGLIDQGDSTALTSTVSRLGNPDAWELKAEKTVEKQLTVHPNPNPGERIQITLNHFQPHEKVGLTIHDITGRVIQATGTVTNEQGQARAEMAISPLNARGIYIIKAAAPSGAKQTKLVLE